MSEESIIVVGGGIAGLTSAALLAKEGFSVTLGIGILTSVFTALFLTRIFIDLYIVTSKPNNVKV